MDWYRVHSLKHGSVDVTAENWLSALGAGLGRMGVVQDLSRIACETLPNGRILVRDVKSGAGYVVVAIATEHAIEDEPTGEVELQSLPPDNITASLGVDDIAADVAAADDPVDAIRRAVAGASVLAPAEAGAVLRRHTDGWLSFEGAFGPNADRLAGVVLPPGTGVAGFCVERRIAVSLNNAYADARFFAQIDRYTGYVTRNLLCLPLLHDNAIYGCLELINSKRTANFTRDNVADVDVVASALAARLAREPIPSPPAATGR